MAWAEVLVLMVTERALRGSAFGGAGRFTRKAPKCGLNGDYSAG